jgi:hypothetical protein
MNKSFKLLIAVLVLGFLAGCGGSSSSGGDEGKISFANIAKSFPVFNDTGLTPDSIYSGKYYYPVSNTSAYESAVNGTGGFSLNYSDTYENDYFKYISPNFNAIAVIYFDDSIALYLDSDPTVTHNDALYKSTFPSIDEEISDVYLQKDYSGNASAAFTAYFDSFDSSWTHYGDNITSWSVIKTDAEGLTYYGYADAYSSSSHIVWGIYK